jgi:hypothetical protein
VNGNGVIGHKQRIEALEEKIPCKEDSCLGLKALNSYKEDLKTKEKEMEGKTIEKKKVSMTQVSMWVAIGMMVLTIARDFILKFIKP